MNEVRFIKNNNKRWKETEALLSSRKAANPDMLARLYIELTDDLAFAKTFFPNSKTTKYLNQLTLQSYAKVFKKRKTGTRGPAHFFANTYPLMIYKNRKNLLYAFLVFVISALIGVVSLQYDTDYVRLILGDAYVNTTINNIEKGTPMAIYSSHSEWTMFFLIAWNNIKVSFMAFSMGILAGLGSFYVLFFNGVMLGTFQYFFITKGLALESFMAVWLHGTIEISSIVIAGAAGIGLGRAVLFPGTLPRQLAIKKGGTEGAIIVAGLIPFFLLAAFIESFITRHYHFSFVLDTVIIGASALLIMGYFFIYPFYIHKKTSTS